MIAEAMEFKGELVVSGDYGFAIKHITLRVENFGGFDS